MEESGCTVFLLMEESECTMFNGREWVYDV